MASASVSAGKTAMPVTTVTLKGIVEQLADGHDLPKKQANALLSGMPQSSHRRDHTDRREQEGSLSPSQGAEGSRLNAPGWAPG